MINKKRKFEKYEFLYVLGFLFIIIGGILSLSISGPLLLFSSLQDSSLQENMILKMIYSGLSIFILGSIFLGLSMHYGKIGEIK